MVAGAATPAPERIGVFGGTFDPVHVGHLVAAINARHALSLGRVLMVVANRPWQKARDREVSPAEDRFAVVQAAVDGVDGIEASRLEIDRGGDSYTIETLEALRAEAPEAELFVIIGSDVAAQLSTWGRAPEIASIATLVVVERGGCAPFEVSPGWKAVSVRIPALEISSTDLRARVAEGRPLDFLVPQPAVHSIRQRGLYADGG